MLRRLIAEAMKGDQKSIQFVLALHERYGAGDDAAPDLAELLAEDAQIFARYFSAPTSPVAGESSAAKKRRT